MAAKHRALPRVGHVSIICMGCSKNLVDSERLARRLSDAGFTVSFDDDVPPRNSAVVVNTCGFIGDAKEESVSMLLQVSALREKRKIRRFYVMGCLSERYRTELADEIDNIDGLYGKFDWDGIVGDLLAHAGEGDTEVAAAGTTEKAWERQLKDLPYSAYIKISEGCNRFCSFCAIPLITGRHHSRPADEIIEEMTKLASEGTREFNIIAQDLSSYGRDLADGGEAPLARLLERMAAVPGAEMIRLHYAYPSDFPYEILPVMASHANICKYLDIALQHIDDTVLANMRRHIDGAGTRELLARIRREVPGIHIRTTLMTGFPGETDEAFERLVEFVKEQRFERMGAFAYCEEEGTYGAEHFDDSIAEEVKNARLDRLMELQESITEEVAAEKVGKTLRVIIDEILYDGTAQGRTEYDSPEVDCNVYIENRPDLEVGQIYNVKITSNDLIDLFGEVVD